MGVYEKLIICLCFLCHNHVEDIILLFVFLGQASHETLTFEAALLDHLTIKIKQIIRTPSRWCMTLTGERLLGMSIALRIKENIICLSCSKPSVSHSACRLTELRNRESRIAGFTRWSPMIKIINASQSTRRRAENEELAQSAAVGSRDEAI